jgi:hypothetical protein
VGKGMSDLFGGCIVFATFRWDGFVVCQTYVSHMGRCGWEDTELSNGKRDVKGKVKLVLVSFLSPN